MKDKWEVTLLWSPVSTASLVKNQGIPPQWKLLLAWVWGQTCCWPIGFVSSPISYCLLKSETVHWAVAYTLHQHGLWTTCKLALAVALCWKGAGYSFKSSLYSIKPKQFILFSCELESLFFLWADLVICCCINLVIWSFEPIDLIVTVHSILFIALFHL